jgi:hypothetical protein
MCVWCACVRACVREFSTMSSLNRNRSKVFPSASLSTILLTRMRSASIPPYILKLCTRLRNGIIFKLLPLYPRGGDPGTHCVGVRLRPRTDLSPMVKIKSFPLKCQNFDFHILACRLAEHLFTHLVAYFM